MSEKVFLMLLINVFYICYLLGLVVFGGSLQMYLGNVLLNQFEIMFG